VLRRDTPEINHAVDAGTGVQLELELFQRTGTFRARGAIVLADELPLVDYQALPRRSSVSACRISIQ